MKNILRYVITSVLGVAVVLTILGVRGTFAQTDKVTIYKDLCDAFAVPGLVLTCFGALIFASNGGVFYMLKFGVIKMFDLFRRDLTKVKYRTFYDYKQAQEGKEKSFVYILIVGVALTSVAVVFLILFNNL